jgi:hypothetical protein
VLLFEEIFECDEELFDDKYSNDAPDSLFCAEKKPEKTSCFSCFIKNLFDDEIEDKSDEGDELDDELVLLLLLVNKSTWLTCTGLKAEHCELAINL